MILSTDDHEHRLAVVIPAFKARHFARALESLAAQTDRRFRVYVADDGSPEDIAGIAAGFEGQLDLVYRRFPENLGRTSLVRHWDRAIALSDERWIWLFSDDDELSPDCVAGFWAEHARRGGATALYRFNVTWIDADGRPYGPGEFPPYPEFQTGPELIRAMFDPRARQVCIIQNMIFSREVYRSEGGFTDYPSGISSDTVTWPRFARHGGIRAIRAGTVRYRVHASSLMGGTVFATADRTTAIRVNGDSLLVLRALIPRAQAGGLAWAQLCWFGRTFRYAPKALSRGERAEAGRVLRRCWPAWPGVREAVFWSQALRPVLRKTRWGKWLAQRRCGDGKTAMGSEA